MLGRPILLCSIIVSLISLTAGCNKNSISAGHNTLAKIIELDVIKYTTKSLSQKNLYQATKSNAVTYGLLGSFEQESIGVSTYSFATQFRLPNNGANFGENPVLDSVILYIPVANTTDSILKTNTSLSDISVSIYALDEIMKPRDSIYRSDYDFKKIAPPLATNNSWTSVLDSVKYVDSKGVVKTKRPGLKVILDKSYFTKTILPLKSDELKDNSKFIQVFKGLYITCSENQAGFVTKFDLLKAECTLHHKNKSGENKSVVFSVNSFASRANLVQFETAKLKALETATDKGYLQALIGIKPLISLMDRDEIVRLRDSNLILSQARLYIEKHPDDKSKYTPKTLTIYQNDKPISESSGNGFGGKEEKGKYFFNITNLVQKTLKKGDTATSLKVSIHSIGESQGVESLILDNSKTKFELHYGK